MKTLEEIKKEYPTLTSNGWTYFSRTDNKKIASGDISKHPEEFKAICDFLNENIGHTKTVNTEGSSSYGLKHVVEDMIHHYISNGMFIAAALGCGYKMKYKSHYGPNAFFAMSQKDWKKFWNIRGQGGPRLDRENLK
tara:strand:+ start:111 stop:521 length:411 start_codon:yes stop_codon:yes gene_type:complete